MSSVVVLFLIIRRPPRSTLTDPLFPYTPLFRSAAMDYISTRGSAPTLDFRAATLAGLASDGGLYVPAAWPRLSPGEIRAFAGLDYVETAVRVDRKSIRLNSSH